jgi:hypothetical protein
MWPFDFHDAQTATTVIFRLLADAITVFHAAFVAFVVLGGFLVLRWRRVAWLHVPSFVWGAVVELTGWICPLTPLEKHVRARAGEAGYAGGFVDHYVLRALYPEGLTPRIQLVLGTLVLAVNGVVYWFVWRSRKRSE